MLLLRIEEAAKAIQIVTAVINNTAYGADRGLLLEVGHALGNELVDIGVLHMLRPNALELLSPLQPAPLPSQPLLLPSWLLPLPLQPLQLLLQRRQMPWLQGINID